MIAAAVLPSWALGAEWKIQNTFNPTGATSATLDGVSCLSESSCLAVGGSLAESWDGTTWADQPVAALPRSASLGAVSCVSSTFCVAVGGTGTLGSRGSTVAEMWNGATWAVSRTPNPRGKQDNVLSGVSCVTASFCAAVGQWNKGIAAGTIVELWNGKRWQLETTPTAGNEDAYLRAISCVSTNACTAVGSYSVKGQPFPVGHALVDRWNGRRWLLQHAPTLTWGPDLAGVSCASWSSCMAVGSQTPGQSSYIQAAAERWDGARWVAATTGLPSTGNHAEVHPTEVRLFSVSCVSATICTAVGSAYVNSGRGWPIVELWNGRRWSAEATPRVSNFSGFNGVSCVRNLGCTAVGDAGSLATLAESDATSTPSAIS